MPSTDTTQQLQAAAADWEESMVGCVAALLPCLPARELQAIDRSAHPSHQSMSDESVSSCFFCFLVIRNGCSFLLLNSEKVGHVGN